MKTVRSCNLTQEARWALTQGVGRFALGGRGLFAAFGGGRVAAGRQPGFAKGGTGHPDLRPGFLYPLLRLPLTFRSAALPFGHAAKKRGMQLRPLYYPGRFDAVWGWLRASFRAYKCAAAGSGQID